MKKRHLLLLLVATVYISAFSSDAGTALPDNRLGVMTSFKTGIQPKFDNSYTNIRLAIDYGYIGSVVGASVKMEFLSYQLLSNGKLSDGAKPVFPLSATTLMEFNIVKNHSIIFDIGFGFNITSTFSTDPDVTNYNLAFDAGITYAPIRNLGFRGGLSFIVSAITSYEYKKSYSSTYSNTFGNLYVIEPYLGLYALF